MKIGRMVRRHIPAILEYCETYDRAEFARLQDADFSKETLDINYPFCMPVAKISEVDWVRYWSKEHSVHGIQVKVTNHWFNPPISRSLTLFRRYLNQRNIGIDDGMDPECEELDNAPSQVAERAARGRYRGNAIGNAQNLLVRNILSRLGDEQFSENHWQQTVASFASRCAYCDAEGEVGMDHVVPINKQALGEHRLGNLVPSCGACNAKKAERDFREFLSNDSARIAAIEAHMAKHAYLPIGANEKLRQIIELAHQDVRQLADRYVAIINTVLRDGQGGA